MPTAEELLKHAENCAQLAEEAKDQPSKARFRRMEEAWRSLAGVAGWRVCEAGAGFKKRRSR